ncbi:MAG: hypothetical protein JSW03_08380 [Candidatus Eiseniibacteriota bacterium]|nr:MAG: hypothetical protein JSW03_08380 [Candidatus Eisenbacteria bacterium]
MEETPTDEPRLTLTWRLRPCTMDLRKCTFVVAVIVGFGLIVLLLWHDPFLALLSVVILVGSLHNYFFASTYSLSSKGVEIRGLFGTQKKEWSSFKSFWVDSGGVSLSPFRRRSWLEHYRGMRLLVSGNRGEVVDFVTHAMGKESQRG